MSGAHGPTRVGCAGTGCRLDPQQEQGHGGLLDGQSQASAGSEVEFRAFAAAFDNQRAKPGATRRIGRAPEQRLGIRRLTQHQRIGIAAQLNQAGAMDMPAATRGFVGTKPEDRRSATYGTKRQHGSEARSAWRVISFSGKQLMNSSARQASVKHIIKRWVTGAYPLPGQPPATGNRSQFRLQHDKMINRLAHLLFLICSQVRFVVRRVKLTKNQGNGDPSAATANHCGSGPICIDRRIHDNAD